MAHDYRRNDQDPTGGTGVTRSSSDLPGKRTLAESLSETGGATTSTPVQRKADGPATEGNVHDAAQRGIADTGSRLPHLDLIQRSFGAHDVSNVQAHTGEAAARANGEIGAQAYATGNHVAFAGTPDLHTAAHEAAHVVQQRGGVQLKGGIGEAGDPYEQNADAVADRVVRGESAANLLPAGPSTGGASVQRREAGGAQAGVVQRQEAAAPPPPDPGQAAPAGPVFVEFTRTGEWDAEQVLATLSSQASVPEELKAAILAGPKATAKYCVALRGRVEPPDETISNALTSRVTELVYATSRSPLQYSQLADVAKWSTQWPAVAGAKTDAKADAADAKEDAKPGEAGASKGDAAAAEYATKLAANNPRIREGDKDVIRTAADTKNDTHAGEESGNAALTGWSFVHDPFANTVIAVRTNGTGIQYTFQVEKGEGAPTITRVNTEELSELRVKMARRQELSAPQREQETAAGMAARIEGDKEQGRKARADFRTNNPGAVEKWEADVKAWQDGGKQGPRPKVPVDAKGVPYQEGDHKTTACTATPTDMFHAGGGNAKDFFPFTPPTTWKSWRSLATNPEGPKLGDVYYLYDLVKHQGAHMGVVKSRTPVPGQADFETWVVTDGGQGGYEKIQLEQERTRGPYNKKTGIFSSSIAEAGQNKGDRKLTGWVDVDAFKAEHEPPVSV